MSHQKHYRQFVAQFKAAEWKRLAKHRVFLHFLRFDLKTAASIAADVLQRPVTYRFPVLEKALARPKARGGRRSTGLSRHRRFRF